MNVLVTGASGFIGGHLCQLLAARGHAVKAMGRGRQPAQLAAGASWVQGPDLRDPCPEWSEGLREVEAVVHLAGLAHRLEAEEGSRPEDYHQINGCATRSLAMAVASRPGVRTLLHLSSVAVHGLPATLPLVESSPLRPDSAYGRSKLEGELALRESLGQSQCRWGVLRPVLVFGPGNPGNMARLAAQVRRGLPVPVGLRPNRRSFLFVGNLVHAIAAFLEHPEPPSGRTWLIADTEGRSTAELVTAMALALGRRPRLLRCPESVLRLSAGAGELLNLAGLPLPWNRAVLRKLLGDFYVDAKALRHDLGWAPPFSFEEAVRLTFQAEGDALKKSMPIITN